jgi:alkylation response protein AidB-like acyl-CoA dehydrogenase
MGDYAARVRAIAPTVSRCAPASEAAHELVPEVVDALHVSGLFRMGLPESAGGGGLGRLETARVVEALARVDGSTAWTTYVLTGGFAVLGVFDPATQSQVLDDPRALVGLAGSPPGSIRASAVDGGYVFGGHSTFCSGSRHATWFVLSGVVDDGTRVLGLCPASDVRVLDTWHVAGLRATGSNHVEVDDVFVPGERVAELRPRPVADPDVGLAFVGIGIAEHALELLRDLSATSVPFLSTTPLRERADVQTAAAECRALIETARLFLVDAWSGVAAAVEQGEWPTPDQLARLRLAFVTASRSAAEAATLAYTAGGSGAMFEENELERCWRAFGAGSAR